MTTYEIPVEELARFDVFQGDEKVLSGEDIYQVREWIEEKLEEKVGFFVSLQENFDEDENEYQVYMHTDNYEDLSEEDLTVLETHQIDDSPTCTEVLSNFLGYKVQFTHFVSGKE